MSKFIVGNTYKMSSTLTLMLKVGMAAEFKGEDGVFTVAEINDGGDLSVPVGAAFTDDITSSRTDDRCAIPDYVVEDCTLINVGATA